jgi:hypothetical protein
VHYVGKRVYIGTHPGLGEQTDIWWGVSVLIAAGKGHCLDGSSCTLKLDMLWVLFNQDGDHEFPEIGEIEV